MQVAEQKKAAKKFSEDWKGQGYEKGQSQAFWIALLSDVLGVKDPAQYIEFEDEVHLDKTSFIDGYIPKTHVLIEQKGINKDLNKAWIIHLGIGDMKSHLAGLKATFGALRILTERRSW